MVYKFFDQKTSGSGMKNENMLHKQLAEEFYKPIIRKFQITFYRQYLDC